MHEQISSPKKRTTGILPTLSAIPTVTIEGAEKKVVPENKMLKFLKSKLRIFDEDESSYFEFYKCLLDQTDTAKLERT